jgi:hypothetical protein
MNRVVIRILYLITLITAFSLQVHPVFCEVIFQDDFESDSNSWESTLGHWLTNWDAGYCTIFKTDGFGPMLKMGPGYKSNNGVYAWRGPGAANVYLECMKELTGNNVKTEVYHRWYMKMPDPTRYDKTCSAGCKLMRWLLRERGYGASPFPEIFLQFSHHPLWPQENKISTGVMKVLLPNGTKYDLHAESLQMDNQWHCHEIHLKLNSNGNSDGVLEYWFDGILQHSYTGINWTWDAAQPIGVHNIRVGTGNCSDEPWDQAEWSAVAFDNIVLSTTYVGPAGDTTPLSPPKNLRVP